MFSNDIIKRISSSVRIWDCSSRQFLQPVVKHVVCEDGTEYRFLAYNNGGALITLPTILEDPTRFIISRATGITCNNSMPAFDGDIVQFFTIDYPKESSDGLVEEVRWDGLGHWKPFRDPRYIEDECGDWIDHQAGFTIIGNKFENPEKLALCIPRRNHNGH